MTFGEKLQQQRKARGWTQEDLANQISISRQTLSKWEQGTVIPDTENVLRVSKIFGASTDYLLNDDYENNADTPTVRGSTEHPTKKCTARNRMLIGICLAGLGLIGFVVIFILSLYFPATYAVYVDDKLDYACWGIGGFVLENRLEWLIGLFILVIIVGMILLIPAVFKKIKHKHS